MPVDVLESVVETTPASVRRAAPLARPAVPVLGRTPENSRRNWTTTSFMLLFHAGAVGALFMFSWKAVVVAAVCYFFAINVGIGMGYHRLLTHRGYKTPKWVESFLAVCGTLSLEGGPVFWVSTHRVHHQHSDSEGDPRVPSDSTSWAHMGWIMHGDSLHQDTAMLARYAPDLAKDRFHMLLSKYHWVPMALLGLGLLAAGGWSWVMGGILFRTTLGLHATWLVNSATHLWGSRRFETRDDSRNNWWVALLTGGEGWHNNHHAHPVSARHGLKWYEFDPNYYGIWLLKAVGLAKNVQIASYDRNDPRPAGA